MKLLHGLAGWILFALLSACGGGGGDVASNGGGVGSGGTGIVAGNITGLGSVIVQGTRYDESRAVLESRPDLVNATALALADLHIGQFAYLELDAAGVPTRVRVESQLVGGAADVNAAAGRFTVWGQPVLVNRDPALGPVTVFSGYAGVAEMHAGDAVQVYGALQSGEGGADVIHATRIERLSAAGALPARVSGTLQQGSGGTLLLAGRRLDATAAASTSALVAGSVVTAVVPWTASLPASWRASAVALLAPAAASSVRVSGAVHLLPAGRALVQGIDVDLSALPQAQRDQVREGSYLTLAGQPRDGDGSRMMASQLEALPAGGQDAQLRGAITAVTGTRSFVVRGHVVDASNAQFSGAMPGALAVGMYVEVQGPQGSAAVLATRVNVPMMMPERAVLEIAGTVQSVDAAMRVAQVQYDGYGVRAAFPAGLPLPAAGQVISVAGYWDGSLLQVREVEPQR